MADQPDPEEETTGKASSAGRRLLGLNLWTVVVGPVLVALIVAGILAGAGALFSRPGPELEALPPIVHNGPEEAEEVPSRSQFIATRQTDKSKARVEVRFQNIGDRSAVLTAALFKVRKLVVVPPCGVGAALKVSASYDVVLPRENAVGKTVEVPINQLIRADDADRFVFRVGSRFRPEDVGRTLIYQLDVAIRSTGTDGPTNVGRVLVALPGSPEAPSSSPEGCEVSVLQTLRQVSRLSGARGEEFGRVLALSRP